MKHAKFGGGIIVKPQFFLKIAFGNKEHITD